MKGIQRAVPLSRTETGLRIAAFLLGAAATVFSLVWTLVRGESFVLRCICVFLALFLPALAERLLSFRMKPLPFVLVQLFIPVFGLGKCFHLYEVLPWWDILTHFWGGLVLAVTGILLFRLPDRKKSGKAAPAFRLALFAVCFAVAAGTFWELAEFAADALFGLDMQMDTVLHRINSSLLGGGNPWDVGSIADISETIVNGQALPEAGLFDISAVGNGFTLTTATAGSGKLFTVAPVQTFSVKYKYVVEKGSIFTDYSLNLEDDVKMNLYTTKADSVAYVQGEETYLIGAAEENGAWVIDTIAAKQMAEPIDAYAFKKSGSTIKIDYTKGISVKSYVDGKPADTLEDGDEKTALEATLATLLVYGKYAEKYFAGDYTDLTADELTAIGLEELPEIDVTNLTDAEYVVTGMADLRLEPEAESGFYGTSAVLGDAISLKFYFKGSSFDGKTATVNGEDTALETEGDYKTVKAAVRAKNFDAPVTVVIDGVGSVTDSVSGYTSRLDDENSARLVTALRAYGADAMRYAAAKDAAAAEG